MTFVKVDHPRRIDEVIDYFGERRLVEARDVRLCGFAGDAPEPRGDEAA